LLSSNQRIKSPKKHFCDEKQSFSFSKPIKKTLKSGKIFLKNASTLQEDFKILLEDLLNSSRRFFGCSGSRFFSPSEEFFS